MPRYDDRDSRDSRGTTRLYVGHLSSRTMSRDLDDIFSRYGRVRDVDMKRDYAFVEFSDPRDADDARYGLNGRDVDGSRIIVEFAKGVPRSSGGSRDSQGRGPPPGSGRCFNCGIEGHWARDCKAGDWKNRCYRCGKQGHVERKCPSSPRKTSHGRSYSRSPSRHGRSQSRSYSRSRSLSRSPVRKERKVDREDRRSRSPARKERSLDREDRRSRSPVRKERSVEREDRRSRSPRRHRASPPPSKGRKHSSDSDDRSPRRKGTPSPRDDRAANGSDYSGSPKKDRDRNGDLDRDTGLKDKSPFEENGRSHSPSPIPRDNGSPVDDSPRGSD